MSPPPDDPLTSEAAAPLDAIRGDAVASSDEATPQQAVKPSRGTERLLALVAGGLPFDPAFYCWELFRIPGEKVIEISNWGALAAEITAYERIDTLVILTHGGLSPGELYVGANQRPIRALAAGVTGSGESDPFVGLSQWPGSIGTLKLEGCSVGADPVGLYLFAEEINVTRVETWTMGHYLSVYQGTVTGDRADAVLKWRESGVLERASPWLLKNGDGATFSAKELEQELLEKGQFAHFAEVFGESLTFAIHDFAELMADTNFHFDPRLHFPRAAGVRDTWEIRSRTQAAEFASLLKPSSPDTVAPPDALHRVIVVPTR